MTFKAFSTKTKSPDLRVLMIGPQLGMLGGITTLVETLLPVLEKRVSLFYFASVKSRALKDSGKMSLGNIGIAISQYARFLRDLLRFRPNIIHLHTSQGLAWLKDTFYVITGKIFRCHIVLHIHGGDFVTLYTASPRLVQNYTRRILGLADAVITVSTEWQSRFNSLIPADRVYAYKNCIDTQSIQPNLSQNSSTRSNILFIGRISQLKGAFDLIEALHSLRSTGLNFQAWIIGPEGEAGDFQKACDRLAKLELAGVCELLGATPREKTLQFLSQADIFVLPSYYEGLPMALLEASAAGLPVIATSVGGIPEVVQEGCNGFLLLPGDIQSLADRLARLIVDPALRSQMGQHSREIAVRDIDVKPYVERLISLYSSFNNQL
jgi:glycosyltransferase involved in cell wall biosynthesis